MSAAKGPSRKNAGRGGRRPAGRPATSSGSAGRPAARPPSATRETPGVRTTGPRPVPFGRGRALRILGGLFVFTFGFAVAAVLVVAGQQVTPPYYVAIVAGVAGLAVAGVAMARGMPPMPETPIWSRDTLGQLSSAAGLRPVPVIVTLYVLTLLGVLGNLIYPLTFGVD